MNVRTLFALVVSSVVLVPSLASAVELKLKLVDGDGEPVAGASIGQFALNDHQKESQWSFHNGGKSDEEGLATVEIEFQGDRPLLLYALSEDKSLAGFHEVAKDAAEEEIEVTLEPARHVKGTFKSSELEELGRQVERTIVYLFRGDERPMRFMSNDRKFEFFVPAGDYKLLAYGTHLDDVVKEIEIEPWDKELDLGEIDLPAAKLVKLFGKPAPELVGVKGWMNGDETTLESLRGKVVILDFWGYWCGPCIGSMPHLMKLHDEYKDKDLVIIAVHDDTVADLDELKEKIAPYVEKHWDGRELPFLVALDGGKGDDAARGATTAAYGISAWPTSVLINREGNVVDHFHPASDEAREKIEKLLGDDKPE